jgi:hypothetical protein
MGMIMVVGMGMVMIRLVQAEAGRVQSGQAGRVVRLLPSVNANLPDDIASAILAHDQDTSREASSSSRPWRTSPLGVWHPGHSQKRSSG